MKVSTVITRAMSGLDKKTVYKSPGKMPSFGASSWPVTAQNDCSGFVDWCLRFSEDRKVRHPLYERINGGWFETSAIHADGLANVGYFTAIAIAKPGAMLVYPDYVGSDGKHHEGHIGIVLDADGSSGVAGVTKIIHCSLSASRNLGDAIQVTGSNAWQAHQNSLIVWFDNLVED